MKYECWCGCGRLIEYHKRPREKRYYSAACRQRACRARNKVIHDTERIIQAALERQWNAIEQDVRRENWQDDLAYRDEHIERQGLTIAKLEWERDAADLKVKLVEEENTFLKNQLADKEAEIVRLKTLLEFQGKRKKGNGGIRHV